MRVVGLRAFEFSVPLAISTLIVEICLHAHRQIATYVFVMDFQMPEMDGFESTKRLRELGYDGAILAVTAFGSEELKQSWFQAGCDEFLEKPLNK